MPCLFGNSGRQAKSIKKSVIVLIRKYFFCSLGSVEYVEIRGNWDYDVQDHQGKLCGTFRKGVEED